MTEEKIQTQETAEIPAPAKAEKRKYRVGEMGPNGYIVRKKRWGDRNDGRLIRTVSAMTKFMPYIMRDRCDALNTFADSFDMTKTEIGRAHV